MNKKLMIASLVSASLLLSSCAESKKTVHVYTTQNESWIQGRVDEPIPSEEERIITIDTSQEKHAQTIEGFGACFNELGWASLGQLPEADRKP